MSNHTLIPILAITTFLLSCNSGNTEQATSRQADSAAVAVIQDVITPDYDTSLAKGKVTDTVICRAHPTQSYALYLPSYYAADRTFPCVFFFDAHGRGALPVYTYKAIAEHYGFILLGANNSKNGIPWEVTHDMVKALITDSRTRLNIDARRIYTSGFSGGSRIAATVALLDGGVAGVIGSAAAFPKVHYELNTKFDYFGVAGQHDFNFTEMTEWDALIAQNGFTHQLITSPGMHGWPSAADFETAILWMQVNAMKQSLIRVNDTLVQALKKDYDKRIAAATAAGNVIDTKDLLDGAVKTLGGLTDIARYVKQVSDLAISDNYKAAAAFQVKVQDDEQKLQQDLMAQFTKQDENWWAKTIADFNKLMRTAKPQEAQMYGRVLSYLGFIAYMNTGKALNAGDLPNAAAYLNIFKMADPKNPDCYYLAAVLDIKKGNTTAVFDDLTKATALGFNDVSLLIADPVFEILHNDDRFKAIVIKARKNLLVN